MRRVVVILLALVMILSLTMGASAASITITPPTLPEGAEEEGITYKAYRVFDATIAYDEDGEIKNAAYTISEGSFFFNAIRAHSNLAENLNPRKVLFILTPTDADPTEYTVEATAYYIDGVLPDDNPGDEIYPLAVLAVTDLAKELSSMVEGVEPDGTSAYVDGKYVISDLPEGYYLVTSSVGDAAILDTIGDITVTTKNTYPTLDKKMDERDDYTSADLGGTVDVTIRVNIPSNASGEIVVHDKMTNLQYLHTTIKGVEGKPFWTVDKDVDDGCDVHFVLSAEFVDAFKGKSVTIGYAAKVTGEEGENEAWLVDGTYTSAHDEVKVYNSKIIIDKYDADQENVKLEGAQFVLYRLVYVASEPPKETLPPGWGQLKAVTDEPVNDVMDDGIKDVIEDLIKETEEPIIDELPDDEEEFTKEYYQYDADTKTVNWVEDKSQATVVTTDANGAADFAGLEFGIEESIIVYYLEEIKAPDGYNLLTDPVEVQLGNSVVENGAVISAVAKVANNSGTELPSTGGMGTTMFYLFGGILVLASAVLLVTKKRMRDIA